MCTWTASRGMRSSAPISGGPKGDPEVVKRLDELGLLMYGQATLPVRTKGAEMTAATREEIQVGELTIRFLLEGEQAAGSVAMFEFDVPAGARVPAAHSHDGYEETIYGLEGTLTWTVEGEPTEVGPGE